MHHVYLSFFEITKLASSKLKKQMFTSTYFQSKMGQGVERMTNLSFSRQNRPRQFIFINTGLSDLLNLQGFEQTFIPAAT